MLHTLSWPPLLKYCSAQETRLQPRSLRAFSGHDHSARWRVDGRLHFQEGRRVAEAAKVAEAVKAVSGVHSVGHRQGTGRCQLTSIECWNQNPC